MLCRYMVCLRLSSFNPYAVNIYTKNDKPDFPIIDDAL